MMRWPCSSTMIALMKALGGVMNRHAETLSIRSVTAPTLWAIAMPLPSSPLVPSWRPPVYWGANRWIHSLFAM